MTRAELLCLVDEGRRAPSVHNIQPARWSAVGDRLLVLYADPVRTLPVADPSGHDVELSLGAAWEGMAIALARRGFTAAPPDRPPTPAPDGSIARLSFEPGAAPDPLAAAVPRRATYRGRFAATATAPLGALERRNAPAGIITVRDRARIRDLAALADQAMEELLLNPQYWRETWHWLRLSPEHPGWNRDGLNADSLALSLMERTLGRWLMTPVCFEWMHRLGLARALISERAQMESAGALLLFTAPQGEAPFETGRSFYRRWLEVTTFGLALCPMSVLADSKRANDEIRRTFSLPEEQRLVNVFRVGVPPPGFPSRLTPRLPPEELIVD
jgi:nitroreductase